LISVNQIEQKYIHLCCLWHFPDLDAEDVCLADIAATSENARFCEGKTDVAIPSTNVRFWHLADILVHVPLPDPAKTKNQAQAKISLRLSTKLLLSSYRPYCVPYP